MAICKNEKCSIGECSQWEGCTAYIPVITNADRIRAKSDEELAEWAANFVIICMKDAGIEAKLDETFVPDLVEFFKLPVEEVNNG